MKLYSKKQQWKQILFLVGIVIIVAIVWLTSLVVNNVKKAELEKIQLWIQEINGISRYIDKNNNIYCMEDILNSKENPRIIGKYGIRENNTYYMITN